jgi:hypothetical protein
LQAGHFDGRFGQGVLDRGPQHPGVGGEIATAGGVGGAGDELPPGLVLAVEAAGDRASQRPAEPEGEVSEQVAGHRRDHEDRETVRIDAVAR